MADFEDRKKIREERRAAKAALNASLSENPKLLHVVTRVKPTVLRQRIKELEDAIRTHRDQRGDDRCWMDDQQLYAVLGDTKANTALPPREVFLANCARFYACRQAPGVSGTNTGPQGRWVSAEELNGFQTQINSLQAEVNSLLEKLPKDK